MPARNKVKGLAAGTTGIFRHQNAGDPFGQTFDPAGKIHRVPDRGVLPALLRADQSHHGSAGVNADADIEVLAARLTGRWRMSPARHEAGLAPSAGPGQR